MKKKKTKQKKTWELHRQWQKWTPEEDDLLKQLYPDMFNFELVDRFGRSSDAICGRAGLLQLKKNWRKYDISRYYRGKRWSKKEIQRLKKLYPIMPNSQLTKYFPKRSKEAIGAQASLHGLKKTYINQPYCPNYNLWREQKDLLVKLYPTTDNKELAQLLGRTAGAIQSQAVKMGLHKPDYIPGEQTGKGERLWTSQEDALIKKLYLTVQAKDLAVQLDRTTDAVITRAARIGVCKKPKNFSPLRTWTDKEIDFLKKYYKIMPATKIAHKLGRTNMAIQQKAQKLGLQKN